MDHERHGEAFEGDIKLTVIGQQLHAGEPAPAFSLDTLEPGDPVPHPVSLADGTGRVRLLHVVNSLDTPVCHIGAHRFEQRAAPLPPTVAVYPVSMDLPVAQLRWRTTEGVSHGALSGHRSEDFGRAYGVLLREWRLFERAVFVIDGGGRLTHVEYVPDQMAEPNYDSALDAARAAAGRA